MTTVLVTGANGFVGTGVCKALIASGDRVKAAVRCTDSSCHNSAAKVLIKNIQANTQWHAVLHDVDVVVHLASRVHVMKETARDPLSEFRLTNVIGTEKLASDCVESGVKRLIFVSSIKVNGESTGDKPFSPDDVPAPSDDYARSKQEAEITLRRIAEKTGLQLVIIRPPLIYGPGVKGNFFRLLQIIKWGIPLPLRNVKNKRSLVSLTNFSDLVKTCVHHPAADGMVYTVADGEDLSTPALVATLSRLMRKDPHLFALPESLLRLAGRLTGTSGQISRLCDSLQIDTTLIHNSLNWYPPYSVERELQKTVDWFLRQKR